VGSFGIRGESLESDDFDEEEGTEDGELYLDLSPTNYFISHFPH
jgi:hypothetical protein